MLYGSGKRSGHCLEVEIPARELHAHCGGMHTVAGPTLRLRLRVTATRLELIASLNRHLHLADKPYASPPSHEPGFPAGEERHVISWQKRITRVMR